MKRIVLTLITIIMLTVLFAVGVQAADEYQYTVDEIRSIMQLSDYYYFAKSTDSGITYVDYDYGTYSDVTFRFTDEIYGGDQTFYGRYSSQTSLSGEWLRLRYPVSITSDSSTVYFLFGYYDAYNKDIKTHVYWDNAFQYIKGVTQSGVEIDPTANPITVTDGDGFYFVEFSEPILFFDVYIKIFGNMVTYGMTQPFIGLHSITTSGAPEPALPTLEENLNAIKQLIELSITPAIENINNYITLIQQQQETSISNLATSNNNYNSTLNNYSSGTINAEQAFNDIVSEFDNALSNAVSNGSVEEAILANAQYQSKMIILEKYIEKSVAAKYENVVSDADKQTVDQALELEKEVLSKFDYEAFESQIKYDSYYQKISNSEMLSLKTIYETFLDSNIGQNFAIVPLTFSIISVLIGGFVVSVKVSQKGGSDG